MSKVQLLTVLHRYRLHSWSSFVVEAGAGSVALHHFTAAVERCSVATAPESGNEIEETAESGAELSIDKSRPAA